MRASLTAAVAVGAAVALTGCSSTTGGSAGNSHRAAPYPTKTAASSSSPAPSPSADTHLDRALLTSHDLGRSFVRTQNDPPAALPCTPTAPPVDAEVHHIEKGAAVFVDDMGGVQVSEQVYVYGAVADAQRHESIDEAGLRCARGRLGTTAVKVTGPVDLRSRLGQPADSARAWGVTTTQFSGALIAVRIHAVMVQFAIIAQTGSTAQIDAQQIVRTAVHKLVVAATN
jgi:hypothetical protein